MDVFDMMGAARRGGMRGLGGLDPTGSTIVPGTVVDVLAGQEIVFEHDQGLYGRWSGSMVLATDVRCEVRGNPAVSVRTDGTWAIDGATKLKVLGSGHGPITSVAAGVVGVTIGDDLVLFRSVDSLYAGERRSVRPLVVREWVAPPPPVDPPVDPPECPEGHYQRISDGVCVPLVPPITLPPTGSGMSTGAKVAIGVGILAVVLGIGWAVTR